MVEREWREASDMRPSVFLLAVILAAAAVLRFLALGAGIPFDVDPDETTLLSRVLQMMRTGDFNPHAFDHPGLYVYTQLGVAILRFLVGATRGEWSALDQAQVSDFYLWGRGLTALVGTLTVLLVYRIGLRWGARHAALAAGLMAVMPLHVRESHYVLTDVPLTFFVTLTLLLTLVAHERERAAAFAWAGAAAGLAAATNYPGALVLVVPLVAVWMTLGTKPSRLTASVAVLGAAAAAFLAAAPYTILDLPGFLNGYALLASTHVDRSPVESAWLATSRLLWRGMAWPAFLLVLTGLGLGTVRAIRGPGRVRWTVTIVFPLFYFYFLSAQTIALGRYLLPVLPFVCVLAAAGAVSGVSLLRRFDIPRAPRTAIIVAITAAALLPPALQSIGFIRMAKRTSTIAQAHTWIISDIPVGSSIVVETHALPLPKAYKVTNVPQLVLTPGSPGNYDAYLQAGADYLVASSQKFGPPLNSPTDFPDLHDAYTRLFGQSREVMRFSPSAEHPGPEIRVFRLR